MYSILHGRINGTKCASLFSIKGAVWKIKHSYAVFIPQHITWAGGIRLICTHEPDGECGHIRQIPTAHVSYICNTSGTLKICSTTSLYYTYMTTYAIHDYGIFILIVL